MSQNLKTDDNFTVEQRKALIKDLMGKELNPNTFRQPSKPKNFPIVDHTHQEIEQALNILKSDPSEKTAAIESYLKDPKKNAYAGKKLSSLLIDYYAGKDSEAGKAIRSQLKDFEDSYDPRSFTTNQFKEVDPNFTFKQREALEKQTNTALDEAVYRMKKIMPTGDNLNKIMTRWNLPQGSISHKKLRELLALDDFGTIAQHAIPLILEHGPKAIAYLWDKFAKKARAWIAPGQDAGLWEGDYTNNAVFNPLKVAVQPGINTKTVLMKDRKDLSGVRLQSDAVAVEYISTLICPERFQWRQPQTLPLKTAISGPTTEFVLTSDANGNAAAWINPNQVSYAGAGTVADFYIQYNPTVFNPVTGAYTAITNLNSPMAANNASYEQIRVTSTVVQVTPVASITTAQGGIQMGYFPYLAQASNVTTQASLMTNAYYQSGNFLQTYRMTTVPDGENAVYQTSGVSTGLNEMFYILITGAPASTKVAKIDIYPQVEFMPTPGQTIMSPVSYPLPGVRTNDLISVMEYAFPAVEMLTFDQAFELASSVFNCHPTYDCVLSLVTEWFSNIKAPIRKSLIQPEQEQEEESFDFV